MIIGIILAAGKGTRIKAKTANKVTLSFLNKPLVLYSVELMEKIANKIVVVVGAFHQSVKQVLKNKKVIYAYQKKRLGTAHAVKVALSEIERLKLKPNLVLVGYGDHMMFYEKEDIDKLINLHQKEKAVMSLVSVISDKNDSLHWGYIIRNKKNEVIDSVEYKDAEEKIRKKVKELNAGFYCFNYQFLKKNIKKISKSKITGEYYINYLIRIAADNSLKVTALNIPFTRVGIGINTWQELEESQKIYLTRK